MIPLKTPKEIRLMQQSGRIAFSILGQVMKRIRPGISTLELEQLAQSLVKKFGVQASFPTVGHYPYSLCVSVNEEVVHGLPGKRKLKKGDLVSIDFGVIFQGWHSDVARTVWIKDETIKNQERKSIEKFLATGKKALEEATREARIGNRVGHISFAIQQVIESAGYNVVKVLTGHGVGRKLHEKPQIPCFLKGRVEQTSVLKEGMVLAIEVMYALGSGEVKVAKDDWTIITSDHSLSAHFENTVAITKKGPVVLTK